MGDLPNSGTETLPLNPFCGALIAIVLGMMGGVLIICLVLSFMAF